MYACMHAYVCVLLFVTQSDKKVHILIKNISCIQAATIVLFLKGYQLHLTYRKYVLHQEGRRAGGALCPDWAHTLKDPPNSSPFPLSISV